jgi:hypothetical protein
MMPETREGSKLEARKWIYTIDLERRAQTLDQANVKRSNTVVKGEISRRAEVVSHDDVTWMDMDTWDVCHIFCHPPPEFVGMPGLFSSAIVFLTCVTGRLFIRSFFHPRPKSLCHCLCPLPCQTNGKTMELKLKLVEEA